MIKIEDKFKDAKWIWYELPFFDLINTWMDAHLAFSIKKKPKKSIVYVTADTKYRLYVNGVFVNYGPARGFQSSWPYDEIDIAPYLKKGKNVIASVVHQLGISTAQYIHQGTAGFLLSGKVGKVNISTESKWRVRKSAAYKKIVRRASREQGFQEHFDAQIDNESWLLPEYDDSDWETPFCRNFGCMPWHSLEPREIPLLKNHYVAPEKIVSMAEGNSKKGFMDIDDVVQFFLDEKPEWKNTNIKLKK